MLRREGATQTAEELEAITDNSIILDQMELRLAAYLTLLQNNDAMTRVVRVSAANILKSLKSRASSAYEDAVYRPTKMLALELESQAPGWGKKLHDAIESGFTSTEIFGSLIVVLDEMFKSDVSIDETMKKRLRSLRETLRNAVSGSP